MCNLDQMRDIKVSKKYIDSLVTNSNISRVKLICARAREYFGSFESNRSTNSIIFSMDEKNNEGKLIVDDNLVNKLKTFFTDDQKKGMELHKDKLCIYILDKKDAFLLAILFTNKVTEFKNNHDADPYIDL